MSPSYSVKWSREEEKAFENAIATHWDVDGDGDSKEQWDKIASMVPTKTMDELKLHYKILFEDVNAIEAGNVQVPNYIGEEASTSTKEGFAGATANEKRSNSNYGGGFSGLGHDSSGQGGKGSSRSEQERRKGIPWTEEEHR